MGSEVWETTTECPGQSEGAWGLMGEEQHPKEDLGALGVMEKAWNVFCRKLSPTGCELMTLPAIQVIPKIHHGSHSPRRFNCLWWEQQQTLLGGAVPGGGSSLLCQVSNRRRTRYYKMPGFTNPCSSYTSFGSSSFTDLSLQPNSQELKVAQLPCNSLVPASGRGPSSKGLSASQHPLLSQWSLQEGSSPDLLAGDGHFPSAPIARPTLT